MKKLSVVIGRFQTNVPHAGHRKLLDTVNITSDFLLIIIGSGRARNSRRNPMDYETRRLMLADLYPNALFANSIDYKSNKVWSDQIDNLIDKEVKRLKTFISEDISVELVGSRNSFIPYYEGEYKTVELKDIAVENCSATNERELISKNPINSPDFRAGVIYSAFMRFPTVFATVDVAIFNEDYSEILLGRKHAETLFRFIGGFADPKDNSYEHTGKRECYEETCVEVDGFEYIASLKVPDWRYLYDDDKIITHIFAGKYIMGAPRGNDDIAAVRWFKIDDLGENDLVSEHGIILHIVKEWHKTKIK